MRYIFVGITMISTFNNNVGKMTNKMFNVLTDLKQGKYINLLRYPSLFKLLQGNGICFG